MNNQYFLGWGRYAYASYVFSYWGDEIFVYDNFIAQGVWRVKNLK